MTRRALSLVLLLLLLVAGSATAAMSGTYYIKKGVTSGDTFPSFVAAATALQAQGLGGNVTFLAFAGVYDEGIVYLQNIAGDTTYTLTFDKVPGQGEVLVTSTSSYAFYIYYNNNTKLKNLSIRGASYGVYSYYSSGVKLEKCRLLGTSYGAMLYYAHYDSVVGCLVTGTSVGLYFYGTSSPISKHNHASNNMISNYSSYAIYSYYNDSLELYDNSFSSSGSYDIYATYATRWDIRGNIFKKWGGSYIYYFSTGCTLGISNKNDLYNAVGSVAYYNSTTYSTLAAWQATGFDSASISADPLLAGGFNLHLRSGSPCIDKGEVLPGISTDYDGDSRGSSPDMGADEYTGAPTPMSGTYTIKQDGTGDYRNFYDAMWDVWGKGFGGDITFEVYAGTYKEQLRLMELNNGNYFLTFKAHVGAGGTDEVWISAGTSYAAWLTHASKVKFIDLKFTGYTSYGAYCQTLTSGPGAYKGNDTLTFRRCVFNGANPIYLYYSSNYDSVIDCQLYATSSYGIYTYATSAYPSGPNVFINNFIVGFTTYGIYSYYNAGNRYYYNTIYSPSCTYPVYEYYATLAAPQYRNNIFYNGSTTTSYYALYMYGSPTPPTSCLNYNCYYYPAGSNIAYVNSAYTWTTLRAAGYEANGINRNPKIGGVINPHLQDDSPCIDSGVNISGIERDIDQEKRDSLPGEGKYDIGADEHTYNVGGPMSGVYTIKQAGGGDFSSITAAISALALRGFGGNVQFDVYNGTYTGTYNLYGIGNGSNWLTFRSYPGQSATCDAGGNSYNWYLNANKRVRIQGLKMVGATNTGIYMYYSGSAPYTGCDSCVISGDTITAPYGIYDYYADDDTISGNVITATSSYGMYIYGYSSPRNVRNVITGNTISGFTSYGIYTYYQDSLRIKSNTITGPYCIYSYYGSADSIVSNNLTATTYGIYLYGTTSSPYTLNNVIAGNTITATSYCMYTYYQDSMRIKNNTTNSGSGLMCYYGNYDSICNNFINATSSYGIYLYGTTSSPYSVGNVVANNMVRGFTSYGLYMYYQSSPLIVFNAFRGTGSYGLYCATNYGYKLHDNIFLANSYAMYNTAGGDTFPLTADNNDYRLNGGGSNVIYHAPSGGMTLSAWQALSGKDGNSIDADPQFVSTSDLHLQTTSPCINAGASYSPFTTDIDGDSRTVNTPDMGADEVLIDVACRSVLSPTGSYKVGDQITPSAAFKHVSGRGAATYYVKMVINRGASQVYADSASRTTSPGDSIVVNFATYVPNAADTNYHATCFHKIICDIVPANDTARSSFTVEPVDVGVYGILAPVGQVWRDQPIHPRVVLKNNSSFPATFTARFTINSGSALKNSAPIDQPTVKELAANGGNTAPATKTATAPGNAGGTVGKSLSTGLTASSTLGAPAVKALSQSQSGQGNTSALGNQTTGSGSAVPTGTDQSPTPGGAGFDALVYDTTQSVTLGAGATETLTYSKAWIPTVDGPHTGACKVTLQYDSDSTNDYIQNQFTVQHLDLGAAALLAPSGTVVVDTVISPTVKVKNYGTADAYCGVRCIIASGATTVYDTTETGIFLAAGDSVTRVFAKTWTASPVGDYTVRAYTINPSDIYPSNDTARATVSVVQVDLGAVLILAPSGHIVERDSVVPSVLIMSYGASDAFFDIRCVVRSGSVTAYDTTETGVFIAAGDSMTLNFTKVWEAGPVGQFTVTAYTMNPYDRNAGNDSAFGAGTVTSSAPPGWSELAPMPASPSRKAIKDGGCLAYDAATDLFYASKGNKSGDFYIYDVRTGAWTDKAGIPLGAEAKQVYKGSALCSDGNGKLYLTKGNNTVGFWGYDAATDAWTQLTNVPYGASHKKVKQGAALAWGTTNGVGYAYLLKGYKNEFYKYDPTANAWIQLLNAPIGSSNHVKWDAGSWMIADPAPGAHRLYAFKGKYHEFYAYDTDADTWLVNLKLTPMPIRGTNGSKKARDGSCAAFYNGAIYMLKGGNTTEFWRYFPDGDTYQAQKDIPLFGVAGTRKKVKNGAAMASYPTTGVYAFKGNKSNEFWRYRPYWEAQSPEPNREGVAAGSTEIRSIAFAIAPNPLSGGLATLRYSLPKAGPATLCVYDVAGRAVLEQTLAVAGAGTATLDLRKLVAGVYLVKVATEGFAATQKLVIEH
jgi:hypothetical protein